MLIAQSRSQSFAALILGLFLLLAVFVVAGKAAALSESSRLSTLIPTPDDPVCPIQSVFLRPIKDNTIYEAEIDQPLMSNGAGDYLFTGNTAGAGLRRALISFDIAGSLPRNSTIISSTLELHMSKTIAGNQSVAIHKVLADWGEGASDALAEEGMGAPADNGDATWQHAFYSGTLWLSPGGYYTPTASAIQTVGFAGSYTWGTTAAMLADVQGWYQDPDNNFGWIIIGNESTLSAKRFDSRENPNEANQPILTVAYSPPICTFLPMAIK